jgi:nucleoside-triphosphatase THEP1
VSNMIYIVSGGINQGKTTKLISIYNEIKCGDGFINKKIFIKGMNAGQEIIRLSTGEGKNFSFRTEFIPKDWKEDCRCGPYSISKEGLTFANGIVQDLLTNRIAPIFIDEIGPLELAGEGFYTIFSMLLKEDLDLYVAIRGVLSSSCRSTF